MDRIIKAFSRHFGWIAGAAMALWFFLPAIATPVLMALLVAAPQRWADRKPFRITVFALTALYAGLLAYTQESTGAMPRDAFRYYERYLELAALGPKEVSARLLDGYVPVFNVARIVLGRVFPTQPQTLSLASVFTTMFFFSLGFGRLCERSGLGRRDTAFLWAISTLLAFNLSQTGEYLKQAPAFSLFFYAFALLADGRLFFLLPLALALGTHNSAAFLLPLLLAARKKITDRGLLVATLVAAATLAIGPFRIIGAVADVLGLEYVAKSSGTYRCDRGSLGSTRDYATLFLYAAFLGHSRFSRPRDERQGKQPLGGFCIGFLLVALASARTNVLFSRLMGANAVFLAASLAWTVAATRGSAGGRFLAWLQLGFLCVSSALFYDAALRPAGHYTFQLYGGDAFGLLGASVPRLLRFGALQ